MCGMKFQLNKLKITKVVNAIGMMGHTGLGDKIRLCLNCIDHV